MQHAHLAALRVTPHHVELLDAQAELACNHHELDVEGPTIDPRALEDRAGAKGAATKRPPAGPIAPPELPALSKVQLEAFAESSEFVVRRPPLAPLKSQPKPASKATPPPKKPDPRRPR